MKKGLFTVLTLLFILIFCINTCFAVTSPESAVSTTQIPANTTVSATNSHNPSTTEQNTISPTSTPSAIPPMDFKVLYNNEQKIVIKKGNDSTIRLKFVFNPRGETFSENFTLLSVTNEATDDVYPVNKNLTVSDSGYSFEWDAYIQSAKIGETIEFTLKWKDFSNTDRKTSAKIEVVAPKPELSIEAVVPSTSVAPGSSAEIKYVIKNTGNVPVKNILIKDTAVTDLNGLNAFTTDDFLAVNGTITKVVKVTVNGEINLSPVITYTYEGQNYEKAGASVKIISQDITPSISLTCDNYVALKKGDDHVFNYLVINTSNVQLLNIRIYNTDSDNAVIIKNIPVLEPGQEFSGSFTTPIEKSGFHKIKIVYSYLNAQSDTEISVKTEKSIKLPNEIFMVVSNVEPEQLTGPGKVTFTLDIENGTNYEISDLVITEDKNLFDRINLNNVVIPAIKNGEPGKYTTTIEADIENDATTVLFNLSYIINNEHTIINASHTVNFAKVSPTPNNETPVPTTEISSTPTPSTTPQPTDDESDNRFILIIILGILFLLILIALIIILVFFKNKNEDPDDDDYDFDDEDLDFEITDDEIVESGFEVSEVKPINADSDIDDDGVKIYKKK